jgi:hypothetical protein
MPIDTTLESLDTLDDTKKGALATLGLEYKEVVVNNKKIYTLNGVNGLKTQKDIDTVLGAKEHERKRAQTAEEKANALASLIPEGETFDTVREKLDNYKALEAAAGGKLDNARMNTLADERAAARMAPLTRELDKHKKDLETAQNTIKAMQQREDARIISDAVRSCAVELGLRESAFASEDSDAILYAQRVMHVIDDPTAPGGRRAVTRDGVGVLPSASFAELWGEIKDKRPHWLKDSKGGGAGGSDSKSGGAGDHSAWTKAGWNDTKQVEIYNTKGEEYANRMAQRAGLQRWDDFIPVQ